MKFKHTLLATALIASLSGTALAKSDLFITSGGISLEDIKARTAQVSDASTFSLETGTAVDSAIEIDLVLFYQNSLMKVLGEYEGYQHLLAVEDTINETLENSDINAFVTVKDIVMTTNIEDSVPYLEVTNDDGEVIQAGADELSSLAMLNPGFDEYDTYTQKWQADHVMYLTDYRTGVTLGAAGLNGEYSIILSKGDDQSLATTAHEIGHNWGGNHEYDDVPDYAIAYAHSWECGDSYTIMHSVNDGTREPMYSNPDIAVDGVYCGDEVEADNARVISGNVSASSQRRDGVDAVGEVSIDASTYTVYEDETLVVTLTRTGDISNEASVKVFAENDTATFGQDFVDVYQTATFAADSSTATVTFDIVNDLLDEDEESFTLALRFPYTLSLADDSEATVYIENVANEDDAGTFTITAPTSLVEGDSGTVTVTRSGETSQEVIVLATSEDGTAEAEIDYLQVNEILYFKAGETQKTFTTEAWADYTDEIAQTYTISLSSDASIAYEAQSAEISIVDTDEGEAGSFIVENGDTTYTEGETITYDINRYYGVTGEVTITGTITWPDYDFDAVTVTATVDDQSITGTWTYTTPDLDIDEEEYEMVISWDASGEATVNSRTNSSNTITSIVEEQSSGGAMNIWLLLLLTPIVFLRRVSFK